MTSIKFHYDVDGNDFLNAGRASSDLKKRLKQLQIPPETSRRISIAMYEGEINMVIHADGGTIDVELTPEKLTMVLADHGPGIADIEKAMTAGWSTASKEAVSLGFGAGMGLPNMKKSSDEMQIDTTVGVGTTITMVINLS